MLFPIPAVERFNDQFFRLGFQAAHVNIIPIGIGPRDVKRFYTADFTELVLSDAGIERIANERRLALQKRELRFGYDQMQIAGFRTHGAVTVLAGNLFRCVDLKLYRPAVATTAINHDGFF